ncbi:MAG: hypothetical protein LAP86_19110 [Acidobacteriia bacterium]|nr:hypothetical protein [Terriglobia bacterium]
MAISDTTPEAREVQSRIHRSMSGEQRILIALEMSLFAREVARERICSEHPDWEEWQVQRELLRIAFLPDPLPADLR